MSGQSQQLIQKLLKAEEEAEALIARARENRVLKLREAKQAADEEIARFRNSEEAKFAAEQAASAKEATSGSLEAKTLADIAQVQSDFANNKKTIVDYMSKKIMTVEPQLSQIQIALMQVNL